MKKLTTLPRPCKQSNSVLRPNSYDPFWEGDRRLEYDRCKWPDPAEDILQHLLLTKFARDIRPTCLPRKEAVPMVTM
jgi:hypothetical protein